MNDPTYDMKVIEHEGLCHYVIYRHGKPIEVSQPFGPIFPSVAYRECEREGKERLDLWVMAHNAIGSEEAQKRWDYIQAVVNNPRGK